MYARMCKHTGTAARSSLGHWQLMSQGMAPAQAPTIEESDSQAEIETDIVTMEELLVFEQIDTV